MKTPHLPDTDLARIGPLPREEKRPELEQVRFHRPLITYNPFHKSAPDTLNITVGPLAGAPARTSWNIIKHNIFQASESQKEFDANLQVAKALYDYASERNVVGFRREFMALNIGISGKIVYWLPTVLNIDGQPVVPFCDPRVGHRLTPAARQFVFSMMNERIRKLEPDLVGVRFAIIQFSKPHENERMPQVHYDDGIEMWDAPTLEKMIRETYEVWAEVREEIRRRPTGTGGTLL